MVSNKMPPLAYRILTQSHTNDIFKNEKIYIYTDNFENGNGLQF